MKSMRHGSNYRTSSGPLNSRCVADSPIGASGAASPATTGGMLSPCSLPDRCNEDSSFRVLALNLFLSAQSPSSRFWKSRGGPKPCSDEGSVRTQKQISEDWEPKSFPVTDLGGKKTKKQKWKAAIRSFFGRGSRDKISADSSRRSENSSCGSVNSTAEGQQLPIKSGDRVKDLLDHPQAAHFHPQNQQNTSLRNSSDHGILAPNALTRSLSKLSCRQLTDDPVERFPLLDLNGYATPASTASSPGSIDSDIGSSRQYKNNNSGRVHRSSAENTPIRNKSMTPKKRYVKENAGSRPLPSAGGRGSNIAVTKQSVNPYQDFKDSMMEMIRAKNISQSSELKDLLKCYLSLNAPQFHDVILEVFAEVCKHGR